MSLWGDVVECAWGFRASYAYPAQLYVPDRSARSGLTPEEVALGLTDYGVPVELADGVPPERLVDTLAAELARDAAEPAAAASCSTCATCSARRPA